MINQDFIYLTYQEHKDLILATHNSLIGLACVKNLCWLDGVLQMLFLLLCCSYQSNEIKNREKDFGERCDGVGLQSSCSTL